VSEAHYLIGADVLAGWREDVLTGKPPVLYSVGTGALARLEIGPGIVWLLGGAPGAGKTALSMQLLLDALRLTPNLRAVVCNIEMPPSVLLDRQLARLSGIALMSFDYRPGSENTFFTEVYAVQLPDLKVKTHQTIRRRCLTADHAERIDQAFATLEPLVERLCFVRPPFDLANVAATADAFFGEDPGLLLMDYIQRIPPPGEHGDKRGSVNATMGYIRQFADAGVAVVVISAIGRTKDSKGRSTYSGDGLNLASFRESSELEYGADDAFIVVPDDDGADVTLRHLKSRHGEPKDIDLDFNGTLQRFTPRNESANTGKLQSALAALWKRTAPGSDEEGSEEE
jgi:replicative DNA helicase